MKFQKTLLRMTTGLLAAALLVIPQAKAASTDLDGHWAKDVIVQWQDQNLIKGYPDGTFRPNNHVTRAEFVTMMNNALGLTGSEAVTFSDVSREDWFYKAVSTAVANGYCSGYENGTFLPNATITRQEAAAMIARAKQLTGDAKGLSVFKDRDQIAGWAEESVAAVLEAGCMSGYPDGTFAASNSITRAEAVASLNRVMDGEDWLPEDAEDQESPEVTLKPVDPNAPSSPDADAYEKYQNMTAEEQKEFIESFEDIDAFIEWYNRAKKAYEDAHPDIIIGGDGNADLGGGN